MPRTPSRGPFSSSSSLVLLLVLFCARLALPGAARGAPSSSAAQADANEPRATAPDNVNGPGAGMAPESSHAPASGVAGGAKSGRVVEGAIGPGGDPADKSDGYGGPAKKLAEAEAELARQKRELIKQRQEQRDKELDAVREALAAAVANDGGDAKAKGAASAKAGKPGKPVIFSGEMSFFRAKEVMNHCSFYQGPIKKGGVTHHWYPAMYRFRCNAAAERGKRVQLIWGKPDDIRVMFGETMEVSYVGAFPHLSLVSYMYAGVADLDLRVAPELIAENFWELEHLRLSLFSDFELEGPCGAPARPPVLFHPATYQCRRPMVPLLAAGFTGLAASPLVYYMPAYKLTSSLVRVVKLMSLAALAHGGRDELAVPTDCSTPLGTKHPECLCLPVAVTQHWEKSLRSPLHPQLVPFTGKQERPFLRFYARAGGAVSLDDTERGTGNVRRYRRRVAPVGWGGADPLARLAGGAKGAKKLGGGGGGGGKGGAGYAGDNDGDGAPAAGKKKAGKPGKAEQPCVINGVTYESEHVMSAFLVAAWAMWLKCEPDAREWRLLAATGRGDAATAHEVLEQMVAAGDDAPALVRPRDGKSALHLAAQNGMLDVVAALYRDFSSPSYGRVFKPGHLRPLNPGLADTATGATPLHAAIFAGFARVALKMLEQADAVRDAAAPALDVNARDFTGNSPLHYAAARACDASGAPGAGRPAACDGQGQDGSMLAVVHLLVAMGAEVDCRNAAGQTPSDLASAAFSIDAAEFLGHFLNAERAGDAPTDARTADDIVKTALAAVRGAADRRQVPASEVVLAKIEARLRKDLARNARLDVVAKDLKGKLTDKMMGMLLGKPAGQGAGAATAAGPAAL